VLVHDVKLLRVSLRKRIMANTAHMLPAEAICLLVSTGNCCCEVLDELLLMCHELSHLARTVAYAPSAPCTRSLCCGEQLFHLCQLCGHFLSTHTHCICAGLKEAERHARATVAAAKCEVVAAIERFLGRAGIAHHLADLRCEVGQRGLVSIQVGTQVCHPGRALGRRGSNALEASAIHTLCGQKLAIEALSARDELIQVVEELAVLLGELGVGRLQADDRPSWRSSRQSPHLLRGQALREEARLPTGHSRGAQPTEEPAALSARCGRGTEQAGTCSPSAWCRAKKATTCSRLGRCPTESPKGGCRSAAEEGGSAPSS